MRIMFAAPFSGVRTSIFISNYYRALQRQAQRSGHETCLFDTQEAIARNDVPDWVRKIYRPLSSVVDALHLMSILERKHADGLAKALDDFSPDILFVYVIQSRCLRQIIRRARSRGVMTVMWVGLSPKVISPGARDTLSEIDCVFTYDEGYISDFRHFGCRHAEVVPLGVDVEQFDSVTPIQQGKDVAFIGMLEDTRMRYLAAIHDLGLGIWSWNFDVSSAPLLEQCYCGQAAGDEAIACLKSAKIGINVHREFEIAGGNFRLFEIPACGVLQIVDARKGIEKYFAPGKEVVLFEDGKDLRKKVAYYLSNSQARLDIASAGRARVRQDHHISERFNQMMCRLDSLRASSRG